MASRKLALIFSICSAIISVYGDNSDGVPLGCDLGWVNDDSTNCYYIQNTKRVTWSEANEECNRMNSMRLRIEDSNELKWFLSYVNNLPSDGYWTDLNDLPPDSSSMQGNSHWKWGSNEFPADNLTVWNTSPQNDGRSNCAGVNIQGKIEDTDCSSRQSYICEAPMADGGCKQGWLNSDIKCYWIANITQPQETITWDQARQRCNTLATTAGFSGGDLFSINGNNDTTFLVNELPFLTVSSKLHWVGLKYTQKTWQWVNGQPINNNYISWVTEPDNVGGIESCAMIRMNGKYSDQNCNSNHNFICKKPQNVAYEITNMGCGLWSRAGKKCYKFFDAPPNTWSDARDYCQAVDGDLLKVENKDEKAWITTQMMAKTQQYWVGLNDRAVEGTYVWADGSSSQSILIPWNQEPNDYFGQEDCGVIYHNGGYNDANCASQAAFICELGNQATCPMSWISRTTPNGLDCYYISDYTNSSLLRTWSEALDYCASQAPDQKSLPLLLAVDDADEKAFIEQQLSKKERNSQGWWTGLTDKSREGYWNFVGQTSLADISLIPWNSEPDNLNGDEDCVMINWGGHYLTQPCDQTSGFLCEKPVPQIVLNLTSTVSGADGKASHALIEMVVFSFVSFVVVHIY